MTRTMLSDIDIRELDRDLQILLATNGTLTRILKIIADDEIVVEIINQQIHPTAPEIPDLERLPDSRILQRQTILKGLSSGEEFIAAEALIAMDLLPTAILRKLTETDHPIGELMVASCLEVFKETAEIWEGELPDWLVSTSERKSPAHAIARRYHMIVDGQSVIVLTEHFLPGIFAAALCGIGQANATPGAK